MTFKGNGEDRHFSRFSAISSLINLKIPKTSFFFNFLLKKRWETFQRQPDPLAKPRSFPRLSWGCQFSSFLPSLGGLNEIPIQAPCLTALPGDSHSSALICPSPRLCVRLALLVSSCLWFFPAHQKNHKLSGDDQRPAPDASCWGYHVGEVSTGGVSHPRPLCHPCP